MEKFCLPAKWAASLTPAGTAPGQASNSNGNGNGSSNESGTGRISLAMAQVGSLSCGKANEGGSTGQGAVSGERVVTAAAAFAGLHCSTAREAQVALNEQRR